MGKKRKNTTPSQSKCHQVELSDEDELTWKLIFTYLNQNKIKVLTLMMIGFSIGSGSGAYMKVNPGDPNRVQTAYRRWSNAMSKTFSPNFNSMGTTTMTTTTTTTTTGERFVNYNSFFGWSTSSSLSSFFSFSNRIDQKTSDLMKFARLREAIVREDGWVHPDLGVLSPAPCGATRGIGMIRNTYNTCQTRCMPGIFPEKQKEQKEQKEQKDSSSSSSSSSSSDVNHDNSYNNYSKDLNTRDKVIHTLNEQERLVDKYRQEEILIKVPLSYQMTRKLALETLTPLIPPATIQRVPLVELDDAALLVLLLANEKGRGRKSKFMPYIDMLPSNPTCGYSPEIRPQVLDTIRLMGIELGMDVNGWPGEMGKASDRAFMISDGLYKDYGNYITVQKGSNAFDTIKWSLCQVASRATAGAEKFGSLRLVPLIDLINHDVNAGGFIELSGNESLKKKYMMDATSKDKGAFVVRSTRHGRRKALKKGQELLSNYNVPNYSPLDWYISLGFVPSERMGNWERAEGYLKKPRVYAI